MELISQFRDQSETPVLAVFLLLAEFRLAITQVHPLVELDKESQQDKQADSQRANQETMVTIKEC